MAEKITISKKYESIECMDKKCTKSTNGPSINRIQNHLMMMEQEREITSKNNIELTFKIPSGEKLILDVPKNFSLKDSVNFLSHNEKFKMAGLIYIYIDGKICSPDDFYSPLENTNFDYDTYFHITRDHNSASKEICVDFKNMNPNFKIIFDSKLPVYNDLAFKTQLKGDVMIS